MNTDKNRRIVIIDDNRSIHDDFRRIFQEWQGQTDGALDSLEADLFGVETVETRLPFEVDSAYQGQEGLALVQAAQAAGRPYALAFVDMRMPPGWDGFETIQHLWRHDPLLQVVICTAYSDCPWEEMLAKLDAGDRLLILKKPFDCVEVSQLAVTLVEKWHLNRQASQEQTRLEQAVRERTREIQTSQALLRGVVDSSPDPIVGMDAQGQIVEWNQRAETAFGYSREEVLGTALRTTLLPEVNLGMLQRHLANGSGALLRAELEVQAKPKDGQRIPVKVSICQVQTDHSPVLIWFVRSLPK